MPRIPGLRRFMRIERTAAGVERGVDDELRFHFDMTMGELMANGLTPDDARREAERRFGDVATARRSLEAIDRSANDQRRRADVWDALRQDARYAVRGLRRAPAFTSIVIGTFALGIGANAAMFGVIDRLLFSAPRYIVQPDRVVRVYFARPAAGWVKQTSQHATFPSLVTLRAQTTAFADLAVYDPQQRVVGNGTAARQIHALGVTANYFGLLGVTPALGRFFDASEDRPPAGTPLAVLGYAYWQSAFGGARDVLGRMITIDRKRYTIVGVGPRGFTGVDRDPVDVVLPISASAVEDDPNWSTALYMSWAKGIARLKPGATIVTAGREASRILRSQETNVSNIDRQSTVKLGPVSRALGPESGEDHNRGRVARWLTAVSLALLLIACANVGNLLLARAARRSRETAVRLALGVSRARLVSLLLVESLLLAFGGGVVGLVVAIWSSRVLQAALLPDVAAGSVVVDSRVAAFAAIAIVGTGLLTGLIPAVHATRPALTAALKGGGRDASLHRSRVRATLTIVQAAVSVVLLIGAGLFVRSLRNIRTLDYGYDPRRAVFVDVSLPDGMSRSDRLATWDRLLDRSRFLPGVEHAALSVTAPFWSTMFKNVYVPGRDSIPQTTSGRPYFNAVTPDYFAALGTPLRAGRVFTNADGSTAPRVAIVNETMARVVWPGENPLGKCLKVGADSMPCSEVVGVVHDVKQRELRGEVAMQFYIPIAQNGAGPAMRVLVIQPRREHGIAAETIRREMLAAEPAAHFVEVHGLEERLEPQIRPWSLGATMFSVFGMLALVTASLGLYSVIAYSVTQRMHEFGVRAALGAGVPRVIGGVVGEGIRTTALGLAAGGVIALVAAPRIESLLFGVSPFDPLVFGVVGAVLFGTAVLASVFPAWRAARVDPAVALRAE